MLFAFALSLLFHVSLLTTIELGSRYGFWQSTPLTALAKVLGIDLSRSLTSQKVRTQPSPADLHPVPAEQEVEMPRLFVDVDPSQATEDTPPDTPYYSPFNSLAANPDTSRDLGRPQLDGTQDKVLKTKDTLRPLSLPQPMQPSVSAPDKAQDTPERPKPPVLAQPVQPVQPAEPAQAPGETLMARATPMMPKIESSQFVQPETPTNATVPPRFRRVADALAAKQLNPYSALVGDKYKQDGGVKRFSVSSSLDVRASPFGTYDARFVAAVQQCWYALLEEQRYSLDRMGKVVLDFRLTADGRISEMRVVQSDVGEICTTLCELAITKPSPYEKWPSDLRKIVGTDYRDVRFTFYY